MIINNCTTASVASPGGVERCCQGFGGEVGGGGEEDGSTWDVLAMSARKRAKVDGESGRTRRTTSSVTTINGAVVVSNNSFVTAPSMAMPPS